MAVSKSQMPYQRTRKVVWSHGIIDAYVGCFPRGLRGSLSEYISSGMLVTKKKKKSKLPVVYMAEYMTSTFLP